MLVMDRMSGHRSTTTASGLVAQDAKKEAVSPLLVVSCGEHSEDATQKRKQAMVQGVKLEKWTLILASKPEHRSLETRCLVINRMIGIRKVVDTRYHADIALDDLGKSALNDCCDLFQQYYRRVGHTQAGRLTQRATETGASWGSYEGRPAAIIIFFNDGVDAEGESRGEPTNFVSWMDHADVRRDRLRSLVETRLQVCCATSQGTTVT